VDGIDFELAMGYSKPFYSHKFKKSGVRYEVGLCIKTGDICWWNGPYEPGIWNNEMIFKDALLSMLEYGERCETDGGYRGSAPDFVKCPKGVWGESGKWAMHGERAIEELGNFDKPLSSQFKAAPNSVCCSYSTSPADL